MIIAVPADRPVTNPSVVITGATAVLLLLQSPPGIASRNVVVVPTHRRVVPVMGSGNGFTVTNTVVIQPVGNVYVMVAKPSVKPETMPLVEPIGATPVLLLLHVPPPASVSNEV